MSIMKCIHTRKLKIVFFPNYRIAIIFALTCIFCFYTYDFNFQQISDYYYTYISDSKKKEIKEWFNDEALIEDEENLHHGSAWSYLTTLQFKAMVLDSISKMDPPIKPHENIFELGVGVGAALKVIENDIGVDQLQFGGSDVAENAIDRVKKIFPKQSKHFFVWDMTKKYHNIPDDYYDHVLSFGALALYLTKYEMVTAIKEAVRITKPGGSLLFTSFVVPGGKSVGSIISPIDKSFFKENAKEWGIENIKIYQMKYQGDRYQVTFKKQG